MILIDSSVWIRFLRGELALKDPDDLFRCVTCGPVQQEVLQGLRECAASERFRQAFLAIPCVPDPLPARLYQQAAELYREGRRRGATIRASNDCLIAVIAMEHKLAVWHHDRDFTAIAQFTPLREVKASVARASGG
jgi:hypothetical protein